MARSSDVCPVCPDHLSTCPSRKDRQETQRPHEDGRLAFLAYRHCVGERSPQPSDEDLPASGRLALRPSFISIFCRERCVGRPTCQIPQPYVRWRASVLRSRGLCDRPIGHRKNPYITYGALYPVPGADGPRLRKIACSGSVCEYLACRGMPLRRSRSCRFGPQR